MAANNRSDIRTLALAGVTCLVATGVAMAFVDRPWSTWSHQALHGMVWFVDLTHLVDPLPPLAGLGLAAAGIAAAAGWRPGARGRVLIACCLAVAIAILLKDQLKYAFGRTWPETWIADNPSWIGNGVFTFAPFHGGQGWASFPSGHTTVMTAPMAVLWRAVARWRVLWGALVVLVVVGLLGADYHWLSDIMAGGFLGIAAGVGAWALVKGVAQSPPGGSVA